MLPHTRTHVRTHAHIHRRSNNWAHSLHHERKRRKNPKQLWLHFSARTVLLRLTEVNGEKTLVVIRNEMLPRRQLHRCRYSQTVGCRRGAEQPNNLQERIRNSYGFSARVSVSAVVRRSSSVTGAGLSPVSDQEMRTNDVYPQYG